MKRVLVTGANKGIGLAIVEAILQQHEDAFVFLGSRSAERGTAARDALLRDHTGWADRLEVLELDVASDDSVTKAAAQVRARFDGESTPLYGVVNNAGIGLGSGDLRAIVAVNTLGIRRVCEQFIPLLRGEGARVVNVTSASGPMYVNGCSAERQRFFLDGSMTLAQLEAFIDECTSAEGSAALSAKGLRGGDAYGFSKACANTYTLILARENPTLKVNACTPGFIATDMTRPYAESSGKTPAQMGMKPPAEGTRAPMHLLFGELSGNGRYYGSDAKRSPLDRYRGPGTPEYEGP